jgi:hypothetical protein
VETTKRLKSLEEWPWTHGPLKTADPAVGGWHEHEQGSH